jgi:hypothetical protein
MKQVNARIFSRALSQVLGQFHAALERNDKDQANFCYATALGLISGATLSGGLNKAKGQELLVTLKDTRVLFTAVFGESPDEPKIQPD